MYVCRVVSGEKKVSVEEHKWLHEEDQKVHFVQRLTAKNGHKCFSPCRVLQNRLSVMLTELNERVRRLGRRCRIAPQSVGMPRSRRPFFTPPCSIRAPRLMPEGPSLAREERGLN